MKINFRLIPAFFVLFFCVFHALSHADIPECEVHLKKYMEITEAGIITKAGQYGIRTKYHTLIDQNRNNRQIPLSIYFPDSAAESMQTFPTIIFSHGTGLNKETHEFLGKYWASHGYVSIHPNHEGSDATLLKEGDSEEVRLYNRGVLEASGLDPRTLEDRIRDIQYVLNSFHEITQRFKELKIDRERVGVAGYSFGANTALLMAQDEPSIKAVLGISPPATSFSKIKKKEPWNITKPMMTISGSVDKLWIDGDSAARRMDPYLSAPAGDKFHVLINGANHYQMVESRRNKDILFTNQVHNQLKISTALFWEHVFNSPLNLPELLTLDQKLSKNGISVLFK